jgi:pyruvate ferredoxin oxidoreductase alpha subunit
LDEVRDALAHARRVIVVEKAFAVGAGGIVGQNTRLSLAHLPVSLYNIVAGLGGRPVTSAALRALFDSVLADQVAPNALHFLGLDTDLVRRELAGAAAGRSGPHAESILRSLGTVRAESH